MPGHDDEKQCWETLPQPLEDAAEDLFFAGVGASSHEHGRARRNGKLRKQCRDVEQPFLDQLRRVEFQIANDVNALGAAANRFEPLRIGRVLATDAGKRAKYSAKQKAPAPVTPKGFL